MTTRFIRSSDSAKIAFQVFGTGPALLLVHGAGDVDKSLWVKLGWVEFLEQHFTVITLDLRGYGESDKSLDPNFYSIDKIQDDLSIILSETGFTEFHYFGHSYGATIGLQIAKQNPNLNRAVCAGSFFGDDFFRNVVPTLIIEHEELLMKKQKNQLDDLSPGYREWILQTDLELSIAQFKAWTSWPAVEPEEIIAKLAVYSGTEDFPDVLIHLEEQTAAMRENNIKLQIFADLNHQDLIVKTDVVLPWILEFLTSE